MNNIKSAFTAILAAILAVAAVAAQAAENPALKLRYGFTAGQKLSAVIQETTDDTEENLMKQSKSRSITSKEIAQEWQVISVKPDGEAAIEMKYKWLRLVRSWGPGANVTIDTRRTIKDTNPAFLQAGPEGEAAIQKMETMRTIFAQLFLDQPIRFAVSGVGTVREVKGLDLIWEKYRLKVEGLVHKIEDRAQLDATIEAFFGEETVHKLFNYTLFVTFPTAPVKVGDEWSDLTEFTYQASLMPIRRKYKLTGVGDRGEIAIAGKNIFEPPTATEEVEYKVPSNTLESRITVDPANGIILRQEYAGKLEYEGYDRKKSDNNMFFRTTSDISGSVLIGTKGDDVEALFSEGMNHFKAKQYEDAIKAFTRVTTLRPGWALPYEKIGLSAFLLERYEDAIAAFKQAIGLAPDWAEPYWSLGSVYNEMHREGEGVEALKQAIRLDSSNAGAYMELGHAYREMGKLEEAIEAYKQAARLNNKALDATWFVGATYQLMGRLEQAAEAFRETVRIKPDYFNGHFSLAAIYAATGKYPEAVECYRKCMQLDPGNAGVFVDLGHVYYKMGSYDRVIDTLNGALRIDPRNVQAHLGLGIVNVHLGNKEAAMEQYNILTDLDPSASVILQDEMNKAGP